MDRHSVAYDLAQREKILFTLAFKTHYTLYGYRPHPVPAFFKYFAFVFFLLPTRLDLAWLKHAFGSAGYADLPFADGARYSRTRILMQLFKERLKLIRKHYAELWFQRTDR